MKNYFIAICLIMCSVLNSSAQQDNFAYRDELKIGRQLFDKKAYVSALKMLEPIYYRVPSQQLAIKIAEAYYNIRNYEKSITYYEMANNLIPLSDMYTQDYFKVLCEFGELDNARRVAIKYIRTNNDSVLFVKLDSIESMMAVDPVYEVFNISSNTDQDEYGLHLLFSNYRILNTNAYSPNKEELDTLIEITKYQRYTNPYFIDIKDTASTEPSYFDFNSSKSRFYDVITCFDPKAMVLYITRGETNDQYLIGYNKLTKLKIITAKLDSSFNVISTQKFEYNDEQYSFGQPYVSRDGNNLYFVSDKMGGFGGLDIYMCTKLIDGTWGFPNNLGSTINTSGDEMYPYTPLSGALYFSSTGHNSMGGLDVFKSNKSRYNTFTQPENLGYPINSLRDDYAFNFIGNYGSEGFVSSNRSGGKGESDIYYFTYYNNKVCRDPHKNFKITCIDKKTKEKIPNVVILMTVKNTGQIYNEVTDLNGEISIGVDGCEDFDVECTHDFYLNNSFYYDGFKKQITIELDKKELNNIIALENIYYDLNKYEIPHSAVTQLDKLTNLLSRNPDITIEMASHTDSRGEYEYNQILSQKRAEQIVEFLVQSGINRTRLIAKGYGKSQLVNDCQKDSDCSDEMHSKNRRTEFRIREISKK